MIRILYTSTTTPFFTLDLQIDSGKVGSNFLDFLQKLGRPMRTPPQQQLQIHVQDIKRSLYWSDASSEMMFYLPSAPKTDTTGAICNTSICYAKLNPSEGPYSYCHEDHHFTCQAKRKLFQ